MSDVGEISCYPVRASAAGAIAELLEVRVVKPIHTLCTRRISATIYNMFYLLLLQNDYLPPEWVPLMQVLVNMIYTEDENESTLLFQLLTTVVEVGDEKVACHIPAIISTVATAVSKHIPPTREPWPQVCVSCSQVDASILSGLNKKFQISCVLLPLHFRSPGSDMLY